MSTDAVRADDVYPAPPKAVVLGFRSVLTNPAGDRLTLHLKADGPPLWRQPGETATSYAERAAQQYPTLQAPLQEIARLFNESRYAPQVGQGHVQRLQTLIRALRRPRP